MMCGKWHSHMRGNVMTKAEAATLDYARTHLQAVRICWLDRNVTICGAVEAVTICFDHGLSSRIVGVVAQDKRFENMLNGLLDRE